MDRLAIKVIEAGNNAEGKGCVLQERVAEPIFPVENVGSFSINNLYYTEMSPIDFSVEHIDKPYDIAIPPGAFRFMICRIPPTQDMINALNLPELQTIEQFKSFGMHETPTVDYWYVTKGEALLIMENGDERLCRAGNFLVMRGGLHAWVNQQTESCELVGVMLGAAPAAS